jgi:hypothetical protein
LDCRRYKQQGGWYRIAWAFLKLRNSPYSSTVSKASILAKIKVFLNYFPINNAEIYL